MADSLTDRLLARAGVLLMLLGLVTGLAIPAFTNPRMALAAHLSGILNGLLLVALSTLWPRLVLSGGQARLALRAALAGSYGNWTASSLAAAWGTSRLTPQSGAGYGAAPWQEGVVQVVQVSQGAALLLALGILVYGLRRPRSA